jgi:GDP-4-dehydro-6-deoxy-D-mannose reductase
MLMLVPSRILITGCQGFVGGYLMEECRKRYPHATMFGLTGHASVSSGMPDVQLLRADITQREEIQHAIVLSRPDLVIHLAAQSSVASSWNDPLGTLKVNAEGTIYLLDALLDEHLTPQIVLVGSCEQYGMVRLEENPIHEESPFRPVNPYAVSKAVQDLYGYQYALAYGLPIIRTRPFNHFGPHQGSAFVIASFARQIALIEAGQMQAVLSVGNLQARRDFLPVEDVVDAYLTLAEHGRPGEAYNIGSGHARSIRAMLDLLLSFARIPVEVYEDPARLRPVDVPLLEADISRIRAHTGWEPKVPFELALQRTLDYWRAVVAAGAS